MTEVTQTARKCKFGVKLYGKRPKNAFYFFLVLQMAQINMVSVFDIHDCAKGDSKGFIKRIQGWGAIPINKLCPNCDMCLSLQNDKRAGGKWRCDKVNTLTGLRCRYGCSVTGGTIFHDLRLPISLFVKFARLWVDNTPLTKINGFLGEGLNQHTLVSYARLLRAVVYHEMIAKRKPIGGFGYVVEIDETKVGKRKYNRGHRVEGQWVFGGICRETGDVFMIPVEKRDAATLIPLIVDWIAPGSVIMSDCWKAYSCLNNIEGQDYQHFTVNHSKTYKDPETDACTNRIEGTWRPYKQAYPSSGRRKVNYNGYGAKYMFLKHCKGRNLDPFVEVFKAAGQMRFPLSPEFIRKLYRLPEPAIAEVGEIDLEIDGDIEAEIMDINFSASVDTDDQPAN